MVSIKEIFIFWNSSYFSKDCFHAIFALAFLIRASISHYIHENPFYCCTLGMNLQLQLCPGVGVLVLNTLQKATEPILPKLFSRSKHIKTWLLHFHLKDRWFNDIQSKSRKLRNMTSWLTESVEWKNGWKIDGRTEWVNGSVHERMYDLINAWRMNVRTNVWMNDLFIYFRVVPLPPPSPLFCFYQLRHKKKKKVSNRQSATFWSRLW